MHTFILLFIIFLLNIKIMIHTHMTAIGYSE